MTDAPPDDRLERLAQAASVVRGDVQLGPALAAAAGARGTAAAAAGVSSAGLLAVLWVAVEIGGLATTADLAALPTRADIARIEARIESSAAAVAALAQAQRELAGDLAASRREMDNRVTLLERQYAEMRANPVETRADADEREERIRRWVRSLLRQAPVSPDASSGPAGLWDHAIYQIIAAPAVGPGWHLSMAADGG